METGLLCFVGSLNLISTKTKLQGKSFQNVGFEIINPFVADISRRYLVHDVLAFHHRNLGFVEGVFLTFDPMEVQHETHHLFGDAFLCVPSTLSWEPKGTPPMPPPQEIRLIRPLISLNKSLLGPYFLGGWLWGGALRFP